MPADTTLPHDWFPGTLPANVVIGEGSWLYSTHAFAHYRSVRPCGVRIGRRSGIYVGTYFNLGPEAEVEIGDWCTLVGPIISTNRRVVVGDHSFIAHDVVVADRAVATPPDAPRWAAGITADGGDVVVGENAWIGTRCVLLGGTRIGDDAIVGAATVVDGDVPAGSIYAGSPGRVVGWVRPGNP